jgi:hypothetical protein
VAYINKERNNAKFFLFKYLRNSSDSADMTVNGSSVPVAFEYTVPSGKTAEIYRLNFQITDGGIGWGEFAGLGTALGNGLKIEVIGTDDAVIIDFLNGETITVNENFNALAGVDAVSSVAAGDDHMPIRWTVARANGGDPLQLEEGQTFRITVQDNLTEVAFFECMVQGKIY